MGEKLELTSPALAPYPHPFQPRRDPAAPYQVKISFLGQTQWQRNWYCPCPPPGENSSEKGFEVLCVFASKGGEGPGGRSGRSGGGVRRVTPHDVHQHSFPLAPPPLENPLSPMIPPDSKQTPVLHTTPRPSSGSMHGVTQSLPHHQQYGQHRQPIWVPLCLPQVPVLCVHVDHVHLGNRAHRWCPAAACSLCPSSLVHPEPTSIEPCFWSRLCSEPLCPGLPQWKCSCRRRYPGDGSPAPRIPG